MLNQLSSADLRALNVFKCVAECGSFSGAQEQLNVNESTISSQMLSFERRLGYSLCTRGRAGFRLTERGKALLVEYSKLLITIDNFRHAANALSDTTLGSLRIGLLDHTMTESGFSTVALLNEFIEAAPKVELNLVQDIQSKLQRDVLEGQLDLALGAFDVSNEHIHSTKLYLEKQYLYCGKAHPLFSVSPPKITVKQLEACNWVDRGYQLDSYRHLPIKQYKSNATAANIESVAVIILAGKHLGYLPSHFAQRLEKQGRLKKLLAPQMSVEVTISLIRSISRRETQAMKTFEDICVKLAKKGAR